jgi:hypothetical protein
MGGHVAVSPRTVLAKKDSLIQAPMDDAIILLSLEKSRYYGGDRVAADVWVKFDGVQDIQTIAETLGAEYDAPVETILADISRFAEEMLDEGLLEVV